MKRFVATTAYLIFALTFSIGAVSFVWLHSPKPVALIAAFFAVCYWPLSVYNTIFSKIERGPTPFTGRIDHPGGGIGVLIAFYCTFKLVASRARIPGGDLLILAVPILGSIILGILFSLLSEWLEVQVRETRWAEQERN